MSGYWPPVTGCQRRRTGRGLVAAVLSLVVPGVGHLAVGERRRGLVMIAVTLALVAAGAWQAVQGPSAAVELLIHPGGLAWLLVGNAALLAFRLFATLDAFRAGAGRRPTRPPRRRWMATAGTTTVLVLLAAAVVTPHAIAGHYTVVTHDLLTTVFAETPDDAADVPGARSPRREPPPADAPPRGSSGEEPEEGGLLEGDPEHAPEPAPEPDTTPPDEDNPWLEGDRLTVAVLGSDAAPGRPGDRMDALLVLSLELDSGQATIFSIERHLREFPLPEPLEGPWEAHCRDAAPGWDYLNALYRCGAERIPDEVAGLYPDAPDPAAAATADTLGELLGLAVDHYAMVDMGGFVRLVDALGGVEVELGQAVEVELSPPSDDHEWRTFDLQPGAQQLDGEAALALVRSRAGTDGADRMRRQRCLMASVAEQADVGTVLGRFPEIAGAIEDHLATSMPLDQLPDLVELLPRIDMGQLATVGFAAPEYTGENATAEVERIRQRVADVLDGPPEAGDEGTDDDPRTC